MKKMIIAVLVLVLPISLGINVFSASDSYQLPELELTVTIPSDYYVITRQTPADDPAFDALDTSGAALLSYFESNNIYLNAFSVANNDEIVVTMTALGSGDLNELSDTTLDTLAANLVKQYANYGIEAIEYDIYQQTQTKFVRVHFYDSANNVHGMQYYTICDGKAMNFTLRSYTGSLTSEQETFIKNVVDSIVFDNAPQAQEVGEDTDPFEYTDQDTGATFTVPANWKQEEFSKPREFIDAKFVSTEEAGCTMIYGSVDLWDQMTSAEKKDLNRAGVNNYYFTEEDIEELFGTASDNISIVTYNGVEYYQIVTDVSSEASNLSVTMTQLLFINNGWAYSFQFSGTSDSKLFPQFVQLVESVQYVLVQNVELVEENTEEDIRSNYRRRTSDSDSETDEWLVPLLISAGALLILVVVIVVICISKAKKKRAETVGQFKNTETNSMAYAVCPVCGQRFPAGGRVCPMCGSNFSDR